MSGEPLHILRSVFGYDAFRGHQQAAIEHVVAGGDALVLMPTGGGKSLCYQIPALCRDGVAIVVSPLIALMQDQVVALRQLGVRAAALNSMLSFGEGVEVARAMRAGELDLVYVAPERLMQPRVLDDLDRCRLALFAIDEAHCVSQWGHDFRPEYLQLATLAERFPGVPRIALTATADGPTRREIVDRLHLSNGRQFVAGFDRPNIRYRIGLKNTPRQQLLRFIRDEHPGESGIVYCLSRRAVEDTATWLRDQGIPAEAYHAGLDKTVRATAQEKFLREDGLVMVATIAFGMGIDKPDVRFVAHLDLPKSLEAYYQETGRAGRDGLPSDAWMVYGMQDVAKVRQMIEGGEASEDKKAVERRKLNALLGFCETARCRRQVLLEYFADSCAPCGNCDTCLEPVETYDGTEHAQKALSAIYRTDQRYGAGHVIDILRGEMTERVRSMGHHRLPTFGVGKDTPKEDWQSVLRQLVAFGHVRVDVAGHGSLLLGPEVRPVLRGEERLLMRKDPQSRKPRTAERRTVLDSPEEETLFQALRARRLDLAKDQGVPPYVIFHDATLVEIARAQPRDLPAMGRLPGIGATKLDRYGAAFLAVVAEFRAQAAE
jgi:ATP-dependent DNA helicase RecQ